MRRPAFFFALLALLAAAAIFIGIDLNGPRHTDIRAFDPDRVAQLDTEMWRSYYDKKPDVLFVQLAQLLREQFHFPVLRSYLTASRAARAAFVFKNGRTREDYERALPDLTAYYAAIRRVSTTPFDERRAARLELEWWIVHRQRAGHGAGDLERALAAAAAELYQVPPESLSVYGRERTLAMNLRDLKAARGGVTESDWKVIDGLLRHSWRSLHEAVQPAR